MAARGGGQSQLSSAAIYPRASTRSHLLALRGLSLRLCLSAGLTSVHDPKASIIVIAGLCDGMDMAAKAVESGC